MNWRIGQKVACVHDDFAGPIECVTQVPKKDQIYVVRGIDERSVPLMDKLALVLIGRYPRGLLLREVCNPPCDCRNGIERGFDEAAFRPVVEDENKSTETVEQLKKLAQDTTVKAPEKVK